MYVGNGFINRYQTITGVGCCCCCCRAAPGVAQWADELLVREGQGLTHSHHIHTPHSGFFGGDLKFNGASVVIGQSDIQLLESEKGFLSQGLLS